MLASIVRTSLFYPVRPLTLVSLFLWALVAILLIAAAAAPALVTSGSSQLGAFRICYPYGGYPSGAGNNVGAGQCYAIDVTCQIWYENYQLPILTGTPCSRFQAVRAFLVLGILLAGFSTVLAYNMFFQHRMADRRLRRSAHWLMGLESFCVMVAMSVAADLFKGGDKGDAFILLVVAWLMGLAAWGLWAAAGQYEEEGVRGVVLSGSAAMVGIVQPKTVLVQSPGNVNMSAQGVVFASGVQQPQPMYGNQQFQPAYQQPYPQPYQQQPYPQQFQSQPPPYQPQYAPQYQPQYAPQQPFQSYQTQPVFAAQAVQLQPLQPPPQQLQQRQQQETDEPPQQQLTTVQQQPIPDVNEPTATVTVTPL